MESKSDYWLETIYLEKRYV